MPFLLLNKATHSKMWVALFRVGNRPDGAISSHNEQQRRCVHTFSALWLLLLALALIQPHVARRRSQRKEWEVYQMPKVDVVKKVTARASHSLTGSHCSEVLFSQPKELRRAPQSQSKVLVLGRQALRWSPITHTLSLQYFKLRQQSERSSMIPENLGTVVMQAIYGIAVTMTPSLVISEPLYTVCSPPALLLGIQLGSGEQQK